MRTTLDHDLELLIRRAMKEHQLSFEEALNSALRTGFTQKKEQREFTQATFSLGSEEDFRWDQALATAESAEDEDLSRELSLRK